MGTLYVVATPIGNMEDLTHRATRILGEVDALACEDTRMTRKIYQRYELESPKTIFSYHEHNEERAGKGILSLLEKGCSVALCSDGGYPAVSDPGYRIISQALEKGHRVEVIPGASAVPTALISSGLSTSSYTYKGFPPRKSGPRKRFFEAEKNLPHTLVVFESPYRVAKTLADALAVLGDRQAAVCIELTKKFEDVQRGYLSDLVEAFTDHKIRGEVTLVIAGNHPRFTRDTSEDSPSTP